MPKEKEKEKLRSSKEQSAKNGKIRTTKVMGGGLYLDLSGSATKNIFVCLINDTTLQAET